ncbi:uroporphyrinogen-III C-methyltransferase [Luminiphilus sp. nBUS_07]|uniref:uroporphyrinogen-III C-methyltransferase n=1 Tax=Luminiphilus sp. nBUS_07 TaxID=3395314 RepID=UPI003EB805B1
MTLTAVLTRPGGVVEPLRIVLEQRGVDSIVQPLINIASISVEDRELITLYPGDICIFISVNAVEQGLANLAPQLRELGSPILAVGRATASAISSAGFDVSVPSQADSEGLLDLDILHGVKGKQIVLVKGEGGRGLLAEALRERGAEVVSYVCYRRAPTEIDAGQFCWQLCEKEHLVFQASSGEIVEQLTDLLGRGGQPNLLDSPVIVPSKRVAKIAAGLGWSRIITAAGAGDDSFLAAIEPLQSQQIKEQTRLNEPLKEQNGMVAESPNDANSELAPIPEDKPAKKPAAADPVSTPASKRNSDRFARTLLVLLLLVLGGGAYLGWAYGLPRYQELMLQLEASDARLAALEGSPDTLARELALGFEQQMAESQALTSAALQASAARQSQRLLEQESVAQLMSERLERVDIRLARLTATDRRAWLANEAAFLVRLSAQRLLVSRDIDAAQALLANADALLMEVNDPRFITARRALAADLARLAVAPRVDSVGLYARFAALIEQAALLQVRVAKAPEPPVPASEGLWSQANAGWRAALDKLSRYLVVQRRSDERAGLLTPDWENLIRQNLRMSLEQAQIAALSANATLFQHAVARARASIEVFTDTDPDRVAAMVAELNGLAALNIAPEIPDLLDSRAALADAIRAIDSGDNVMGVAAPAEVD